MACWKLASPWVVQGARASALGLPFATRERRDRVACRYPGVAWEWGQLSPLRAPKGGHGPLPCFIQGRVLVPQPPCCCTCGATRARRHLRSHPVPSRRPWVLGKAVVPLAENPAEPGGRVPSLLQVREGRAERCPTAAGLERHIHCPGRGARCLNTVCFPEFGPASQLASPRTAAGAAPVLCTAPSVRHPGG